MEIRLFKKQIEAFEYLQDDVTNEVLYGGAARGGKSRLGCTWQILRRLTMPESAGLIGREELVKLRDTTQLTFFEVMKYLGISSYVDFNAQSQMALFKNGSRIFFREIKYLPSDPEFDRLGSYDLTDCFLDEAQQISAKAISVLKGRFSVLSGKGWKTIPKALYTCNPNRSWVYNDFVHPFEEGNLRKDRRFVKALPGDNPHVSQDYLDNLLKADKVTVQRLYYGNFHYDDDPSVLCDFDAISDAFTNDHVKPTGLKYISADLAMQGRDRFIAGVWDGMVCDLTKGCDKLKAKGKEIEQDLKQMMNNNYVPHSRTVADSDGLGAYLESYLEGIKQFHGNARATKEQEFANIKSECGFKLAELINKREIKIICSSDQKQKIIEELGVLKRDKIDADDSRKRIIKKEDMKELLGRSPDYLDMLLMRMYFELKPENYLIFSA
ncbi:MAG: phage terminase large subunit [Bacteroidetes bacterium]|nr:phage terminase large subunit [Bacteroidota bacterium]